MKRNDLPMDWFVPVNSGGYRWASVLHEESTAGEVQRFLVQDNSSSASHRSRTYNLRNLSFELFHVLRETEPTEDAILGFANHYGLLLPRGYDFGRLRDAQTGELVSGEPLDLWVKEIKDLGDAWEFWERARNGDEPWLATYIWWDGSRWDRFEGWDEEGYTGPRAELAVYTDTLLNGITDNLWSRFEVTGPALYALQKFVNEHLKAEVSPRLVYVPQSRGADITIVPVSLLGAIWWAFAQAVAEDRKYERCLGCGRLFCPQAREKRSDSKSCSRACRTRVYRERQRRAKEMHKDGADFGLIAHILQVDERTAKDWVEKPVK